MTPSFPTRRPSDLLVVGLHALARDHDADAADGQQRRPADRGLAAPYAGASAGEAPVSQPRDTERARKGPDTGRSRPAAEFDGDFRPFDGRMGGIRGCGLRHDAHRRTLGIVADQGFRSEENTY